MPTTHQPDLDALHDIRNIMERSSRFISLSGWSGIAAGLCALAGASVAYTRIDEYVSGKSSSSGCAVCLRNELMVIAAVVFVAALLSAIVFTYFKSRSDGVAIWGSAARRLMFNTLFPMLVGGALIIKMILMGYVELVAPATLMFYGLALVNGSKYTMGEVRYLGYAEILTGVAGLFMVHKGLFIWAFGFGVLHIIYGVIMWWRQKESVQ